MESLATLLLGLCLGCWVTGGRGEVNCTIPNCICLDPVGFYCSDPVQDLSGFTTNLVTIQPGTFSQAAFVRNLSLSNNGPLTLQNGSFEGLTNILNLDLSNNMLESLPDGLLSSTTQLLVLDLSRNALPVLNLEAFRGLDDLQVLNLRSNELSIFETTSLLSILPSLNTIHLSGNRFDCGDPRTLELYSALTNPSLNVVDRMFVICSNGSIVIDLNFDLSPTMSTIVPTATTSIVSVTTQLSDSNVSIMPTRVSAPLPSPTATALLATPTTTIELTHTTLIATPTPAIIISTYCEEGVTITRAGYLSWPQTALGEETANPCPHGPATAFARRLCTASGVWSIPVEDQECSSGSATEQLLADITSSDVTESTSEGLSTLFASLSPESPLSLRELDTVTDLAEALVAAGAADVLVLNNTLQALDRVLESSTSTLSGGQGPEISNRIRDIVDSILLDALSINKTQLVLSFSHLAVGGAYLPATNSTQLLASIRVLTNGSVTIGVGRGGGGDVTVEADGNNTVQVTVYSNNDLFADTQCFDPITLLPINDTTVRGEVLTPIISITDDDDDNTTQGNGPDDEEVTLTYTRTPHALEEGEMYVCARWNSSLNCGGGGWTVKDCSLHTTPSGTLQCRCLHQGTYALLEIPAEQATPVPPLDDEVVAASRVVFYILSSVTLPLYLTITITIIVTKHLRCLPLMQCLLNQCLSQGLTYLVLAVSFERDEVLGVCFVLGLVLQYLYLVSLSWMMTHPVLVSIRIFKRLLYEKEWLIAPFAILCWVWPAVPVAIYGGANYQRFTENTTFICWLESGFSPHALTYVTAATVVGVVITLSLCFLLLCCSDYAVETPTYLRLSSQYLTTILFTAVILTQYFTAAAPTFGVNRYHVLPGVGGCALLCGSSFFIINGLLNTKIRSLVLCQKDLVKKRPTGCSGDFKSSRLDPTESANSSNVSTPQPVRRSFLRGNRKATAADPLTNSKGPKVLLRGHPARSTSMNPVPLSLFSNQGHKGRVRHSGDMGGVKVIGLNPSFRLDLTSSAV